MWLDYAVPYRTYCPKRDKGERKDECPISNKEYPTEEREGSGRRLKTEGKGWSGYESLP